jgi:hypothetical protein
MSACAWRPGPLALLGVALFSQRIPPRYPG